MHDYPAIKNLALSSLIPYLPSSCRNFKRSKTLCFGSAVISGLVRQEILLQTAHTPGFLLEEAGCKSLIIHIHRWMGITDDIKQDFMMI